MKSSSFAVLMLSRCFVASAFTIGVPTISTKYEAAKSTLFSEPSPSGKDAGEEQQTVGLDLNLEEMFTMFDAAANEEKFDDAVKKVKKEST